MAASKNIDCRGLSCPEPILHTKIAIKDLSPGDILEVLATDPGAVDDITSWSQSTGNLLIEQDVKDGVYRFLIKKS